MTKIVCFGWGCFGSVLPELVRFFLLVAHGQSLPDLNWLLYGGLLLILLLSYAACAGLFSVAWKPENEFKAVWVGASLPALVATLINAAPPHS
jgi:hypothetical protein